MTGAVESECLRQGPKYSGRGLKINEEAKSLNSTPSEGKVQVVEENLSDAHRPTGAVQPHRRFLNAFAYAVHIKHTDLDKKRAFNLLRMDNFETLQLRPPILSSKGKLLRMSEIVKEVEVLVREERNPS